MPRSLATIPEIVVGNITRGEVVLRNVVVSPHFTRDSGGGVYTAPIDVVTPWKPPTDGGVRTQPVDGAKQFDEKMTAGDFAKLAPDTRVIFIDGDEVINASREEAPDFFMNGAYFIGAFAPQAAEAVIEDMMRNPIKSPEEQNAENIAQIMKAQAAFALTALTYFNAYLDTDKAWDEFQGLSDIEDDVLTTPPVVKAPEVPKNFPAEREVEIKLAPDMMGDDQRKHREYLNRILQRVPKAVLNDSKSVFTTPRGETIPYSRFVLWIPDSVTDIQVLEAINGIMKTDMNVSILSKRLTGINIPVRPDTSGITPLLQIPEENKAVVVDKYRALQEAIAASANRVIWGYDDKGNLVQYRYGDAVRDPELQSMQVQAQEIERKTGVPSGCAPVTPNAVPPQLVQQSCLKPKPPPPPKPPAVVMPPRPPSPPPKPPPGTGSGGIGKP